MRNKKKKWKVGVLSMGMMSMGRYLDNTVEYNEIRKRSGRLECQRTDVNEKVYL